MSENAPRRHRGLELALIGVAAVWGLTFPMVKDAVEELPPFEFLAVRFAIAGVLMTAVFWRGLRALGRRGLFAGALAGLALFAGYSFQTVGLQYTEASVAGFITGLFAVFTPILTAVLLRRTPARGVLLGVLVATIGLFLLSDTGDGFQIGHGERLVLLCAVSFAAHIVILGRYSPGLPSGPLTAVQMWVVAAAAAWGSLIAEAPTPPESGSVWIALLVTGVLASAAGFFIQTLAQRYVSPSRTGLILVSEPAFAGLFGFLLLGERLTGIGWIGAALILAGMVAAEVTPTRAREG